MNPVMDALKPFTLLVGWRIQTAHWISALFCVHLRL